MKKIAIIGAGFTGTMVAVQLIRNCSQPIQLFIIDSKVNFNKGIAYGPYSTKHLLNVMAGKMSAFPDAPDDFLNWVMKKDAFKNEDRRSVSESFLSRSLYGEYISDVWMEHVNQNGAEVHLIECSVENLNQNNGGIELSLNNGSTLLTDYCVIATGNQLPRNPAIKNPDFFSSEKYFQNPWKVNSVSDISSDKPVVIVGNGLTMVDTIIGLQENGIKNKIYSISPNGFNILQHQHHELKYEGLVKELSEEITLLGIVKLVNKHVKLLKRQGISAEPVIDSLRPHTHRIWKKLSSREKRVFMSRLRHLWGVARHRIPSQVYKKIQELESDGRLTILAGKLIDIKIEDDVVCIDYFNKKEKKQYNFQADRVINCTGPETDLGLLKEDNFLRKCFEKGVVCQDELKLGIRTNTETFQVYKNNGEQHPNLFTLGPNLKGELWESVAVNELRMQAKNLAECIYSKIILPVI